MIVLCVVVGRHDVPVLTVHMVRVFFPTFAIEAYQYFHFEPRQSRIIDRNGLHDSLECPDVGL
jgi:hypothetical protein